MLIVQPWWCRWILGVFLVSSATLLAARQHGDKSRNESSSIPAFKSTVNRVIVDVVVTDQNGKTVHGLTRRDFALWEDGLRQTVLTFDVHNLDSGLRSVYRLPPLPLNTFVNIPTTQERGPLYVLLLDLVNTELDDQAYARQQLLKFIRKKPEGTRFAIFTVSDGMHLVQGFTADQSLLASALDPSSPRPHIPRLFLFGSNFGANDPLQATTVLENIARYLNGLPGRKNVIWFSGHFPLQLYAREANPHLDLRNDALQMLDLLAKSETSVFTVNVRGVVHNPEGALTGANPNGAASASDSGPMAFGPVNASDTSVQPTTDTTKANTGISDVAAAARSAMASSSLIVDQATQDDIASITGGRAFYSSNDLVGALDQAAEMGANYYTVTYSPSNKNFDGKLRSIRVRLAKKGLQLNYRTSYYATGPDSPAMSVLPASAGVPPSRPVGDSLAANMQRGAPDARQVIFRAHVRPVGLPAMGTPEQMANLAQQPAYFRNRRKNKPPKPLAPMLLQTYIVDYTIIGRYPHFEVAAGVYDEESRMLNGDVLEASSATPESSPMAPDGTYYRAQQRIDVPPKALFMRLAVRDMTTDRIGSIEFRLPLSPEIEPPQDAAPQNSTVPTASSD